MNKMKRLSARRKPLFAVIALAIGLILIEGLCSTVHCVHTFASKWVSSAAEKVHTEYDADLGWTTQKNVSIEDAYGPSVGIRTNEQGFRASQDYSIAVPEGRFRIVCSGDSFTWGHGVGNDDTWPACLERLEARIETVNVGLGGYGFDQAYLRHQRDARALDRNLHIFAFIKEDLDRMAMSSFFGYGKPQLTVDAAGELQVTNVPVPKRSKLRVFLTRNSNLPFESRTFLVLSQVARKLRVPKPQVTRIDETDQQNAVRRIIETLGQQEKLQGSQLLLVFLPIKDDQRMRNSTSRWRNFFRQQADDLHIAYLDLVHPFQRLASQEVEELFRTWDDSPMYHYGKKGNEWVAREIEGWLSEHGLAPANRQHAQPGMQIDAQKGVVD
jgi:hypothetical protein